MAIARRSFVSIRALATIALVLAFPHASRAQTFVEVAGGSNELPSAPGNGAYSHGFNARASIGRELDSRFSLRLDAFTSTFSRADSTQLFPPCAFPGCTQSYYNVQHQSFGAAGLTMNGLMNLDPRGLFYLIAGTGVVDAFGHTPSGSNEFHLAASGGAGIAVPIGARMRVVVEAQFRGLLGASSVTPWVLPLTIGVRY
jgi:hypothetical protein